MKGETRTELAAEPHCKFFCSCHFSFPESILSPSPYPSPSNSHLHGLLPTQQPQTPLGAFLLTQKALTLSSSYLLPFQSCQNLQLA